MRPALGRLRECQEVSGVFNPSDRPHVSVPQRLRECHRAVVKTVVRTEPPRVAHGRANYRAKTSQEFTRCVSASQEVSWRLSASQRVSGAASRPRFDGLSASRTSDTVRRMEQVLCDVHEVATGAGQRPVSARLAAAWHGTRNTVPSIAFAAGSLAAGPRSASKNEVGR